jgi:ADP-ribose pyrophosphatase
MPDHSELADRPADVALSRSEPLAMGFFDYKRYRLTLHGAAQTRDVVLAGKVVAVLPIDPARDEIVLIRQFRLPAHLANGRGELIETVAGRVEVGEQPADRAVHVSDHAGVNRRGGDCLSRRRRCHARAGAH